MPGISTLAHSSELSLTLDVPARRSSKTFQSLDSFVSPEQLVGSVFVGFRRFEHGRRVNKLVVATGSRLERRDPPCGKGNSLLVVKYDAKTSPSLFTDSPGNCGRAVCSLVRTSAGVLLRAKELDKPFRGIWGAV